MHDNTEGRRRRKGWIWLGAGLLLSAAGGTVGVFGLTDRGTASQPAGDPGPGAATEVLGTSEKKTDNGSAQAKSADFTISGSLNESLAPGVSRPLNLVLSNPYVTAITVTGVTVSVADATTTEGQPNPACVGSDNLEVAKQLTTPVVLEGKATKSLAQLGIVPSSWPQILMRNLPTNQDACRNTVFTLSYSGSANQS